MKKPNAFRLVALEVRLAEADSVASARVRELQDEVRELTVQAERATAIEVRLAEADNAASACVRELDDDALVLEADVHVHEG